MWNSGRTRCRRQTDTDRCLKIHDDQGNLPKTCFEMKIQTAPAVPFVKLRVYAKKVHNSRLLMVIVAASFTLAGCGAGGDSPSDAASSTSLDTGTASAGVTAAPSTSVDTGTAPHGPTAAVARSVCDAGVYGPDFKLSTAQSIDPVVTLPKPAKGVQVIEPAYKTCLVRSTDHVADGISGFTRNDYSRRQAFNADSSKFLAYALDGRWHVYDAKSRARLKALTGPAGDAEPQWSSTNPDVLYFIPTNGVGMKLNELTVSSGVTRTLGDFSARLKAEWPTANAAWTKSEGSPSKDGRYWCLMVDDAQFAGVGVFTWDRDTDTILGTMSVAGERPDHVSMSPSGSYCVVSGDGPRGTVAYARDFQTKRKLLQKSEHSDIAIDANGDDTYVSVDYESDKGDLFMVNLRTGERTALLPTYVAGSATALHVSGKSFNHPGWVLVSTYGDYGGRQWLHKKIFAVQLKASPKVYTLAFTRAVENGYWTEPQATVNRDFTKVLFNSNWGVNADTDVDAYMIELPAGAVQ